MDRDGWLGGVPRPRPRRGRLLRHGASPRRGMSPILRPIGLAALLLLPATTADDTSGVTLSVFNNSAFHGPPASSRTVPGLSFTREPVLTGTSIELVGTLVLPPRPAVFNFTCTFANTSYAFLWIDDHLVCQDGNIYRPPTSRLDLPLGRLSKAALPVVLRAYVGPSRPPRSPRAGPIKFIGNYYDGIHGKAGPRVLRYGPQSYGFTPEGCAAACRTYEFIALQDVGGRWGRKACGGAEGGGALGPNCTATSGFCSCDSDRAHVVSQGKVMAPAGCVDQPVQRCSYVNSVYQGAPAPILPPLPPGTEMRVTSIAVSWQQLSPASVYNGAPGPALSPLLPLDSRSLSLVAPPAPAAAAAAAAALSPSLAAVEVRRRTMQARLASGWGTWVFDDLLALAELPSGLTVRPMVCPRSNGSSAAAASSAAGCLDSLIVNAGGEGGSDVRVGGHAYDRSFAEVESLSWNVSSGKALDLRLRWGQTPAKQLVWLCTALPSSTADPADFELRFVVSYSWMRAGSVLANSSSAAAATVGDNRQPVLRTGTAADTTFVSHGLGRTTLTVRSSGSERTTSRDVLSPGAFATVPLQAGKAVGLTSNSSSYPTVAAIQTALEEAEAVQKQIYAKYAGYAEVRRAVEAAVMWNLISVPAELGPFAPVSRGWSFAPNAVSKDWDYVIFVSMGTHHSCHAVIPPIPSLDSYQINGRAYKY
jgi:hypothetical protein